MEMLRAIILGRPGEIGLSPAAKAAIEARVGPITEHVTSETAVTFTGERGRITVAIRQVDSKYYVDALCVCTCVSCAINGTHA